MKSEISKFQKLIEAIKIGEIEIIYNLLSDGETIINKNVIIDVLSLCNEVSLRPALNHPRLQNAPDGFSKQEVQKILNQRLQVSLRNGLQGLVNQLALCAEFCPQGYDKKEFIKEVLNENYQPHVTLLGMVMLQISPEQKLEAVRLLFNNGADFSKRFIDAGIYTTVLFKAISTQDPALVSYLLNECQVDPDQEVMFSESECETPLYRVSSFDLSNPNTAKIFKLLIEKSKALDSSKNCKALLAELGSLQKKITTEIKYAYEQRLQQAVAKSQAAAAAKASDEESLLIPPFKQRDPIAEAVRNCSSYIARPHPRALKLIAENVDIIYPVTLLPKIVQEKRLGFLLGASLVNPQIKDIFLQRGTFQGFEFIFSDPLIAPNANQTEKLLNLLKECASCEADFVAENGVSMNVFLDRTFALLQLSKTEFPKADIDLIVKDSLQNGHRAIVHFLISKNLFDINEIKAVNDSSTTALGVAIRNNNLDLALYLLAKPDVAIDKFFLFNDFAECKSATFDSLKDHPKLRDLFGAEEIAEINERRKAGEIINEVAPHIVDPKKSPKEILAKIDKIKNPQIKKEAINKHVFIRKGFDSTLLCGLVTRTDDNVLNLLDGLIQRGANSDIRILMGTEFEPVLRAFNSSYWREDYHEVKSAVFKKLIAAANNEETISEVQDVFKKDHAVFLDKFSMMTLSEQKKLSVEKASAASIKEAFRKRALEIAKLKEIEEAQIAEQNRIAQARAEKLRKKAEKAAAVSIDEVKENMEVASAAVDSVSSVSVSTLPSAVSLAQVLENPKKIKVKPIVQSTTELPVSKKVEEPAAASAVEPAPQVVGAGRRAQKVKNFVESILQKIASNAVDLASQKNISPESSLVLESEILPSQNLPESSSVQSNLVELNTEIISSSTPLPHREILEDLPPQQSSSASSSEASILPVESSASSSPAMSSLAMESLLLKSPTLLDIGEGKMALINPNGLIVSVRQSDADDVQNFQSGKTSQLPKAELMLQQSSASNSDFVKLIDPVQLFSDGRMMILPPNSVIPVTLLQQDLQQQADAEFQQFKMQQAMEAEKFKVEQATKILAAQHKTMVGRVGNPSAQTLQQVVNPQQQSESAASRQS